MSRGSSVYGAGDTGVTVRGCGHERYIQKRSKKAVFTLLQDMVCHCRDSAGSDGCTGNPARFAGARRQDEYDGSRRAGL